MRSRPAVVAALVTTFMLVLMAGPAQASALPGDTAGINQPSGTVRLMAVGDVMLAQSIGRRIVRYGAAAPWRKVVGYFDQADLVLANLECTISTRGTPWPKDFTFRAPPAAADSLVAAGIDIVNMANNHALDFGVDAFRDTLATLDSHAVSHIGGGLNERSAHAPLIVERNGLRVGFLGYVLSFAPEGGFHMREWAAGPDTPGLAVATPDVVAREVAALKPQVGVVVVTFHGGREYSRGPNRKVRDFSDAALHAGAALVIGHHPHVLQGYRRDDSTLIAYSIGNFVFDYFTGRPNDTAILDVTLSAAGVQSVHWIPIVIKDGFPRPAVGDEIPRVMGRLVELH